MSRHRHGREASREPHIIVMPESKLWIGVYKCWHHAFAGLRRQADPSRWFVVRANWQPTDWRLLEPWEGWVKLDEPHEMRVPRGGYL